MNIEDDPVLSPAVRRNILSNELDTVLGKLDCSLADVMAHVEEHMLARAEASNDQRERQLLREAYDNLRFKRRDIEKRFKNEFRGLLNESIEPKSAAEHLSKDFSWSELKLVDTEEIEDDMQIKRLSDKIKNTVDWELRDLNARMSYLLGREGAEETDNPLRPELFCRALDRACRELEADHQARLEVMQAFSSALSQNIGAVYHDLNERLISHKVLPKIRLRAPVKTASETDKTPSVPGEAASAPQPATPERMQIDGSIDSVVESTLSMFEALQNLVAHSQTYRNMLGSTSTVAGTQRNLMGAIQELRHVHAVALDMPSQSGSTALTSVPPSGAVGTDTVVVPQAMPNFIWANRDQLAAAAGSNLDRVKIDIVAMLFDQILADDKVPNEIKMLLGRLQLPVLRVSLSDGSFFASRRHPARRLVDRIASCSVGYESEGDANHRFYKEAERIVTTIMRDFDDDSGLYERLLQEFEQFLDRERSQENDILARAADVLERAEDREVLAVNITIQMADLLKGVDLDPRLRDFLLSDWTQVLAEAALRTGDAGYEARVTRLKQLCVDLVWSAQYKRTADDRKLLVSLLPKLIGGLREGLALIRYTKEKESQFLMILMDIHSRVVRAGAEEFIGWVDVGLFAQRMSTLALSRDSAAAQNAVTQFKPSEEATRRLIEEDDTPIELVQSLPSAPAASGASNLNGMDAGSLPMSEFEAGRIMNELERGQWLELKIENAYSKVKLAWISPLKSFFLFVGDNGQRAHSLNPDVLLSLLRSRDLRRIEHEPLVDRAVRSVMANLERQPAANQELPVAA